MGVVDGWFCFERENNSVRPADFQSPELDALFLEDPTVKINAVWCVAAPDMRLLFFWGHRSLHNAATHYNGRFGYYARRFRPFFEQFCSGATSLLSDTVRDASSEAAIKFVADITIDASTIFEVYAGRGVAFYYLVGAIPIAQRTQSNWRSYLIDRSERGYEFCKQADYFFEHIPKPILKANLDIETLFCQYFGPNCFDLMAEPNVPFAWPWQKSLELRSAGLSPKQIPTISFVMDLRNSSSAMLLTRDPSKFSMFVDEVVSTGRNLITRHGGYFDKDTGDGVVGHFQAADDLETDPTSLSHALVVAREVVIETNRLCNAYQESLTLRLRGLGCAVGLFAGSAVWLYSWRGVRAIGGSVVNASRICSNAQPGEVGYCNLISRVLRSGALKNTGFPSEGSVRSINISEIREQAIPEATFVQLGAM